MSRIAGEPAHEVGTVNIIGIGIDAVDLDRFAQMLQRTPSTRERIFTEVEREYAASMADPTGTLAARFAAREATMKALGVGLGSFGLHDVWIRNEESGRPVLMVEGTAGDIARRAGVHQWSVSLTHTATVAMAYVIASGVEHPVDR